MAHAIGKTEICPKCGATYHFQWGTVGDPMCYKCAKEKHHHMIIPEDEQKTDWKLNSSLRCPKCLSMVPHTMPQHYIAVKESDKLLAASEELGSDTSSGQNEPKMDYIEVENGTVVSGIRPFTLDDFVSVKKRQLLSVTNKIITSQQVYKTGKSAGINWWDEQQNMSAEQVHKDIQKAKEQWKKGSLWHYNSSSSSY